MGAYNFQKQFAAPILAGVKRTTIRQRRKNGYLPKAGEMLALYTGMRTRGCRLLMRAPCLSVTPVAVIPHGIEGEVLEIVFDGRQLAPSEKLEVAKREGFATVADMGRFFAQKYGQGGVSGYMIEWNPEALAA